MTCLSKESLDLKPGILTPELMLLPPELSYDRTTDAGYKKGAMMRELEQAS